MFTVQSIPVSTFLWFSLSRGELRRWETLYHRLFGHSFWETGDSFLPSFISSLSTALLANKNSPPHFNRSTQCDKKNHQYSTDKYYWVTFLYLQSHVRENVRVGRSVHNNLLIKIKIKGPVNMGLWPIMVKLGTILM